jgi:hypothetical protein
MPWRCTSWAQVPISNAGHLRRTWRVELGVGNVGGSEPAHPAQQAFGEPGHIGDEQDANREDPEHGQRGPCHLEDRLLEAVRRQQQIQSERRMEVSELEVGDEDHAEMHVADAIDVGERQDQRTSIRFFRRSARHEPQAISMARRRRREAFGGRRAARPRTREARSDVGLGCYAPECLSGRRSGKIEAGARVSRSDS